MERWRRVLRDFAWKRPRLIFATRCLCASAFFGPMTRLEDLRTAPVFTPFGRLLNGLVFCGLMRFVREVGFLCASVEAFACADFGASRFFRLVLG